MSSEISIVMAAYNEAKCIRNAIESIQNQTFTNWELIIVDDGSTDETTAIVKQYAANDKRILLLKNHKNMTLPASLNKGIKHASAPLIARADADDICLPQRLEKQFAFMRKHLEIDVLGTGAWLLGTNGWRVNAVSLPTSHEAIANLPFSKTLFFHSSVMIRRCFFEKVGLYDISYTLAQDKELWQRGLLAGCKYANLKEPLIEYTTNGYVKSWRAIKNQTLSQVKMVNAHRIKNGYFLTIKLLSYSILIKLRIFRPRYLRTVS